jgi:hypothetical protein
MSAIVACNGEKNNMARKFHSVRFGLIVGICLSAAIPARAANEIQPGLWQDTEASEINGKAAPPKISTDCVKPEDAKDPAKMIQASFKDQAQQCSKLNVRENGNVILFEMQCGDPKQGSIDMTMTYTVHSPQHTSSSGKSTMTMMGQKIVSTLTTESKWLSAACAK